MKIKLCPLCDSEMKKSHYCDVCHSFVWRPETVDIHYNADSRNQGEEDCAYGASHDWYGHDMQDRNVSKEKRRTEPAGNRSRKRSETQQKTRSKNVFAKAIVIIIGLNILGSLSGTIVNFFEDQTDSHRVPEYIAAEEITVETEPALEDGDYVEIPVEDLKMYPDGCNGYQHFEMTGHEMVIGLHEWMGVYYGEDIEVSYDDSGNNYQFTDEDGETYTYLQKYFSFDLPTEAYSYIQVDCDSVTEQIHSVEASFGASEQEDAIQLLAQLIELLDTSTDNEEAEKVSRDFFEEQSGSFAMVWHGMNIYAYLDDADGTVWMYVTPFE